MRTLCKNLVNFVAKKILKMDDKINNITSEIYIICSKVLGQIIKNDDNKGHSQIFCKLHDYLKTENSNEFSHSCIACNLNDSIEKIYKFCKNTEVETEFSNELREYNFTVFILLCYLFVEKITTIFKVIGITQEFVESNWNVLIKIRKWANFIKHPKGFLFTHHPNYFYEFETILSNHKEFKSIGYDFVKKFYNKENPEIFKQLIKEIGNKDEINVFIPNPIEICEDLVIFSTQFTEIIKANPYFQGILRTHTHIEDYQS